MRRNSAGALSAESPARLGRRGRAATPITTLAVSAVAVFSLSACQWTSTVQTDRQYEPADGTSASVGQIRLSDVLIVAKAKGQPGALSGQVTNGSEQPVKVTVGSKSFDVAPGTAAQLTGATVPSVQGAPGTNVKLPVQTTAGNTELEVPVLAPQHQYATVTPSQAPTSSQSSGTASATPTGEASSSEAPSPSGEPTSTQSVQPTQG